MVYLHMSPSLSVIRIYVGHPNGYQERAKYDGIITVKYLGDDAAFLEGAIGKADRETRDKVFQMLREAGIKEVQMERHGRRLTLDIQQPIPPTDNQETP